MRRGGFHLKNYNGFGPYEGGAVETRPTRETDLTDTRGLWTYEKDGEKDRRPVYSHS